LNRLKGSWKRSIRRWGVIGHTWAGLLAGLLFFVMSLSGAILAFRPQIEAAYEPPRQAAFCAHVPDPEGALRTAQSLSPGIAVQRITVSPSCPGLLLVQVAGANHSVSKLFYSSSEGAFVGSADVQWLEWIADVHQNLLAGKTGRRFVGLVGIILLLSVFSGGLIWLLSHPQPRHLLPWRGRSTFRRYIFDFHRAVGLIVLPLLLAQAFTGVELAFPQTIQSLLLPSRSRLTKAKKASSSSKSGRHRRKGMLTQVDLSSALLVAEHAMPGGVLREVKFPTQPGQGLELHYWIRGDLQASGNNTVVLNAAGTKPVTIDRFTGHGWKENLLLSLKPFHYGEFGGLAYRTLLSLLGLCFAALSLTGILIYATPKWASWRKSKGIANSKLLVNRASKLVPR
jgi:uncharacterized iron-regulated membrane protein